MKKPSSIKYFLYTLLLITLIALSYNSCHDDGIDPFSLEFTISNKTTTNTSTSDKLTISETSTQKTSTTITSSTTYSGQSSTSITTIPLGTYHNHTETKDFLEAIHQSYSLITKLETIGTSVNNKDIWAICVSDNPETHENEPAVVFTFTIHGNEECATELCLYLLDHLTSNYGNDNRITSIVDNTELWLIPIVNPDGLKNNRRWNENDVDLNRNFSWAWQYDPSGRHGSSAFSEQESRAIRDFFLEKNPSVSIDYHSGTVVVNYLWDYKTKGYPDYKPANDDALLVNWSSYYASQPDFLSLAKISGFSSGITNGGDWYEAYGSLQDWAYSELGTLSYTIEIDRKQPPQPYRLPEIWDENSPGILHFLEKASSGITGIVVNTNGSPLHAQIDIHEINPTGIDPEIYQYTNPSLGDYHKPLLPGTYTMTIASTGYAPQTFNNISVTNTSQTVINATLSTTKEIVPLKKPQQPQLVVDESKFMFIE